MKKDIQYYPGKYTAQLFKGALYDYRYAPDISAYQAAQDFIGALTHIPDAKVGEQLKKVKIIFVEVYPYGAKHEPIAQAIEEEIKINVYPLHIKNMTILSTDFLTAGHFFVLDDHPNSKGHEALASAIAKHVLPDTA